ncbi:TIGR03086 family metal-binding protein [Intrasporangium sp. YIM S08009]|uniref:TIGR03086 family metal-binding protein n=1 Tax=Intrasporangium zincisolvens TaxID=3080018 RepID=UPI002B060AB2|nr:TIGR03086 family metal-binding protein [Intrasporangium sp. YIM S08009]
MTRTPGTTPETHDWPLLSAAHDALRRTVDAVPADAWGDPTPCEAWSVAQVLQHAAGDQLGYAGVLTGRGFPSFDPFAPSGVLDGDPRAFLAPTLDASAAAFSTIAPDDAAVAVPLPQGPLAAPVAVGACALDAAIHAWDIAVATGQPSPVDDDLAAQLQPVALAIVEPLRGFAYAPALPDPADGRSPLADLLRYLGRDPGWSRGRAD